MDILNFARRGKKRKLKESSGVSASVKTAKQFRVTFIVKSEIIYESTTVCITFVT